MTRILSLIFIMFLAFSAGIPGAYAQSNEPEIQAYYLIPSDKEPNTNYVAGIENTMAELRTWFSSVLGGPTFNVAQPTVEVLQLSKTSVELNTDSDPCFCDFPDPYKDIVGVNIRAEADKLIEKLPTDNIGREISRVRVYFTDVYMACPDNSIYNFVPHQIVSGNGVAILTGPILEILASTPPSWNAVCTPTFNNGHWYGVGKVAHELGHALGLQEQPENQATGNTTTIMNDWNGPLGQFPSINFLPQERQYLLTDEWAKKFFKLPIVNGASFLPTALSRGTIASIFGNGLANTTVAADSIPLPTELTGTQVLVRGFLAPLYFVSPGQINFLIPFEIPKNETSVNVQVRVGGVIVQEGMLQLSVSSPGIFQYFIKPTMAPQAVITDINWQLVNRNNRIMPGSHYIIFATGLGEVVPGVQSGQAAGTGMLHHTVTPSKVLVNGKQMPVLFSGLVPGFVGLYQVNFTYLPDPSQEPIGWSIWRELILKSGNQSHAVVVPLEE